MQTTIQTQVTQQDQTILLMQETQEVILLQMHLIWEAILLQILQAKIEHQTTQKTVLTICSSNFLGKGCLHSFLT